MNRARGLGARLMAAIGLVLAIAATTAWLVGVLVGPAIFHAHLVDGTGAAGDPVAHAEIAYGTATMVAMAIALGAGAAAALAVSLVLTRRIGASLSLFGAAAAELAQGRLDARAPTTALGHEFDQLATAFNRMAGRLESSERLRERLLSDVAHELRTPVATIAGTLEGVEDGVIPWGPETLAMLRAQGERLARLAEDLAAVTHAEHGELAIAPVEVDVAAALHAAVDAALHRARQGGVALRVEESDARLRVRADPARLAQILGNLVDNAVRHTPPGGIVTLRAHPLGSGDPGSVALEVEDTGAGIAAEHLEHIFDRFYRADAARDRAHGGSGIGLAIARALARAHGGGIAVASGGPGQGARFTVTLPAAAAAGGGGD